MSADLTPKEQFDMMQEAAYLGYFHLSGSLANGLALVDQGHFIMDHDEILDVIAALILFYRHVTPEEIAAHNQERYDHYFPTDEMRALRPKPPRRTKRGYVYLIKSADGLWKIGETKDPEKRIKSLQVSSRHSLSYECLIETDDVHSLERQLHTKFAETHSHGEWFYLAENDVQYIKSLAEVES